jgi:hypothetical protein
LIWEKVDTPDIPVSTIVWDAVEHRSWEWRSCAVGRRTIGCRRCGAAHAFTGDRLARLPRHPEPCVVGRWPNSIRGVVTLRPQLGGSRITTAVLSTVTDNRLRSIPMHSTTPQYRASYHALLRVLAGAGVTIEEAEHVAADPTAIPTPGKPWIATRSQWQWLQIERAPYTPPYQAPEVVLGNGWSAANSGWGNDDWVVGPLSAKLLEQFHKGSKDLLEMIFAPLPPQSMLVSDGWEDEDGEREDELDADWEVEEEDDAEFTLDDLMNEDCDRKGSSSGFWSEDDDPILHNGLRILEGE